MLDLSEKILKWTEKSLTNFLYKKAIIMPAGFQKFIMSYYPNAKVRKRYFQVLGGTIGEGSFFNTGFVATPNNDLSNLFIGKYVSIAPNVTCICDSCANNGKEINTYSYVKKKLTKTEQIRVDDDVWIGANVTILPGVKIGKCAIIGAGSVVVDDVEAYSVYAGVPAKKIRDIRVGGRICDK